MQNNNVIIEQLKKLLENNTQEWYSIKDCVRVSSLSESSIRRAIDNKQLKASKLIGKWLIKAQLLDEYLSS